MKIVKTYSHLNGLEYLLVHKPHIWDEVQLVISNVDATICKTKESKEKGMVGKMLFSPIEMNSSFKLELEKLEW